MNRKILIITPFFAPETHAAVFRAHKLAKYLNLNDWEVHVLTVDTNYTYNENKALLAELEGVTIHRSKYIEPTFRGIKMALGGSDRTYSTLKGKGLYSNKVENKETIANTKKTVIPGKILFQNILQYIQEKVFRTPDRFWTWKYSAVKKAKEIIKQHDIEIIYTTTLPFTTNEIGIALKRSCNIKWVADFRDPITYARRMYSANGKVYLKQKLIQDLTFNYADHITVLSSSYELIFHDQYEGKYNYKISFIPTGLDDDYLPSQVEEINELVFVGEYLKEYKDDFFELYKKSIHGLPDINIPKIKIIGSRHINEQVVLPFIEQLDLKDHVVFIDHIPQLELYRYIKQAKYVLLISGSKALWWTNFAKLVDYIALQKKVIALVPRISEARSELEKAGRCYFLDGNLEENVNKLKSIFMESVKQPMPENKYWERYLASTQTREYIKIFENL